MEEPLVFGEKGRNLSAIWHHAPPDKSMVILHHGFFGHKIESHRIFVKLARRLAHEGVGVFRFDFFGSGDSDGNLEEATITTWMADSLKAVAFVQSRVKTNLFLLGFSMGAFVAACTAAKTQPQGLILWAPIFHPLKRMLREKELLAEAVKKGVADFQGELVNMRLVEDAAGLKIPKIFKGYKGKILMVMGTEDISAGPSASKNFVSFYKSEGVPLEFHPVEGANHGFDRHDWETEVLDWTCRWIAKAIPPVS